MNLSMASLGSGGNVVITAGLKIQVKVVPINRVGKREGW